MNINNFSNNISYRGAAPVLQPWPQMYIEKKQQKEAPILSIYPCLNENKSSKISIGYINDFHGQLTKMERISEPLSKCDIRLSGGDNFLGDEKNKDLNKAIGKFMKIANIEASATGNHELDMSQKCFYDLAKSIDTKFMNANFRQVIPPSEAAKVYATTNKAPINEEFVSSYVTKKNGEKYGLIGVAPVDMKDRITHPDYYDDCVSLDMENTIKEVQKESDNLKKQGVNKVLLLSHLGFNRDQEVAQKTSGVDAIIGGHSHHLVKGIENGKNLFMSKTNEPVIITQAGKDGENFGILNLEFDKNGIIKSAQNNVIPTKNYQRNLIYKKVFESSLGENDEIGIIKSALPQPANRLIEENPQANFVAEAMKNELGAEIGLLNSANLRNSFETGEFYRLDAKMISPFNNKMTVCNVTEKDLVDAFKYTCKSFVNPNTKPGLYAVSGLNYSVSKSTGELKSLNFIDKDGKSIPIDINNPRNDKTYKVAADSFVMSGGDGNKVMNYKGREEKVLDLDKDTLICDYIKHQNKPIDINQSGLVNIID